MLIDGRKLLVATHNPGKLREFEYMLAPHGIEVVGTGRSPATPQVRCTAAPSLDWTMYHVPFAGR